MIVAVTGSRTQVKHLKEISTDTGVIEGSLYHDDGCMTLAIGI